MRWLCHEALVGCSTAASDSSLDCENFGVECLSVREFGLRDAEDFDIFQAARVAEVVVMSKDSDFPDLVERMGMPPQVLWLACGNTSNRYLKELFQKCLQTALDLLSSGEPIVEINDQLRRQIPKKG